jgi:O-antigen biosynthesis protein
MPDWYLLVLLLAGLSVLGIVWHPLLAAVPLLGLAGGAPIWQAVSSAVHASFPSQASARGSILKLRVFTTFLCLLQPLARLVGRIEQGPTPWRRSVVRRHLPPWPRQVHSWSDHWNASDLWLIAIEARLRLSGAVAQQGGDFDRWDLQVRGGLLAHVRILRVIEDHRAGSQMACFRVQPAWSILGLGVLTISAALVLTAAFDGNPVASIALGVSAIMLLTRAIDETSAAMGVVVPTLLSPTGEAKITPDVPSVLSEENA